MESMDQLADELDGFEQLSTSLMQDCALPGELFTEPNLDSVVEDFAGNDSVRTFDQLFGDIHSHQSSWCEESAMDILNLSVQTTFPATTTSIDITDQPEAPLPHAPRVPHAEPHQPTFPQTNSAKPPPKIGARFSREAISVLRRWLSSHGGNPYPSDEEKEILQHQTGLSKTQISNWLANARRRSGARSTSSHRRHSSSQPVDIPRRPGTPAIEAGTRYLNPLERWFDSPPEHEPATVTAIARAIASEPSCVGAPLYAGPAEYDSDKSLSDLFRESGTGNSHSSGSSLSSAYSHGSRGSSRAPSIIGRRSSRRKSRLGKRRLNVRNTLITPLNRYQCTFCTETFRTKHDWQRHEKSLHIPLERWVCAPNGPQIVDQETGQSYCAFCGEINPNGPHIESHNPLSCQERTFSRKDHLKQHLRLVHNTMLVEALTQHWRVPTPDVRSRCGFCEISMDTWSFRVDHLTDHFKMGHSMADWEGDWGFDDSVLNMVENSIPPYLIEMERNTPAPFMASQAPVESPRNAYELLKSELTWFLQNYNHNFGETPNDELIQLEACRVIFAAEVMMLQDTSTDPTDPIPSSWLRDLITSREDIAGQARFGPIRSQAESAMSIPRLSGKISLFEECPLETQLREFVQAQWASNQAALSDYDLQVEARRIISRIDQEPTFPRDDTVAKWLLMLVGSSTEWLSRFRNRVYCSLDESEETQNTGRLAEDFSSQLLGNHLQFLSDDGEIPRGTSQLEPAASGMTAETNGEGSHTNTSVLGTSQSGSASGSPFLDSRYPPAFSAPSMKQVLAPRDRISSRAYLANSLRNCSATSPNGTCSNCSREKRKDSDLDRRPPWVKTCLYFFNDSNFYRWLARELGHWVVATISPNNPNRHVPSDEELRHQARCILYDDDDPFNPTAADNAEWLRRFKEEFGVIDSLHASS
ncbi:Fc.00g094100.m01.CDS01 [Cosmosporella sp. VM-42]